MKSDKLVDRCSSIKELAFTKKRWFFLF